MDLQFLARVASVILCVLLFTKYSESTCDVNGKTYNVGEVWQEVEQHPDCFLHVCQPGGTYTTNKCDSAHNDVNEETIVETTANVDIVEETTPNVDTLEETTPNVDIVEETTPNVDIVEETTPNVDTLEETTVNVIDVEKSLLTTELAPDDTQDNVSGCTVDDRVVKVGEQIDVPGRCIYRACAGNEQWFMKACPLIGLVPGWILTPEDNSRPYPDCCSRAAPLLDIIPDVVKTLQWSVALKLSYDNNTVDYGNELTPSQVKTEPEVDFWADPNDWFLLSMVDPDAPSRQNATSREFLHWLVGNIPGTNVSSGEVLAEYVGSGPPQDTGLHRYVFLLYKQPGKITFKEPVLDNKSVEGRRKFSIEKFSQNYNLSDPIALNFFVAQYDDYVPEVHKQLGILV